MKKWFPKKKDKAENTDVHSFINIDSTLKMSVASIFQETLISALEGIGGLGEIKYSLSILTQKINNFRKVNIQIYSTYTPSLKLRYVIS